MPPVINKTIIMRLDGSGENPRSLARGPTCGSLLNAGVAWEERVPLYSAFNDRDFPSLAVGVV